MSFFKIPFYIEYTQTAFDINSSTPSTAVDVSEYNSVSFQASLASGTFATAVIQAQYSLDGVNYFDISGKVLSAVGIVGEIPIGSKYFRVYCSTLEGGAGTVDLTIQAKR